MILPTKNIKPVDSLVCTGAYLIEILSQVRIIEFDSLANKLRDTYPKKISNENLYFAIDFLFVIGKVDISDDKIYLVEK